MSQGLRPVRGVFAISLAASVRLAALALSFTALLVIPAGTARAQCAGAGVLVGTCTDSRGFEGCCPSQNSISWCEGNNLCQINCANNAEVPGRSCCEVSDAAGCCDSSIEACVCGIDDFCCDDFWGYGWDSLCVDIAVRQCGGCSGETCTVPSTFCAWDRTEGYYDCGGAYSPAPIGGASPTCPGSTCSPQCSGRQCGADGCGSTCGTCPAAHTCTTAGLCQPDGCTRRCAGRQCGADGCGGSCGPCTANQFCDSAGLCQSGQCIPQCDGKTCGPDGCGSTCGACPPNELCRPDGLCSSVVCTPQCGGRECGPDGCGGQCGACAGGAECVSGLCVIPCEPDCAGRVCGDDGCGGVCGECGLDATCVTGRCQAACSCQDKECGDDGCGRICGFCGPGTDCELLTQKCVAPTVADPAPNTGGPDASGQSCPAGQVWNPYTSSCVVDTTTGAPGNDGCGSGQSARGIAGAWLLLAGVFLALRRRALSRG